MAGTEVLRSVERRNEARPHGEKKTAFASRTDGQSASPAVGSQVQMGKSTSIEWTDHTFNPWWGCTKISPGCDHCYAELWARRVGQSVWGLNESRRFFGAAHWREPYTWNADAARRRQRQRVFCASMADVFENRRDLDAAREQLWRVIADTPHLDWQLLTKRPHSVRHLVPWGNNWPANVWLGTTVEDQDRANLRLPLLLQVPAKVRFLSCEPLIGPVELSGLVRKKGEVHWIIAGGESGPGSRPMEPAWARALRDFSRQRKIAFHFKQWGHWAPSPQGPTTAKSTKLTDGVVLYAIGKKRAGRRLDGKTWNQMPKANP